MPYQLLYVTITFLMPGHTACEELPQPDSTMKYVAPHTPFPCICCKMESRSKHNIQNDEIYF
jgi:hypothetical protein